MKTCKIEGCNIKQYVKGYCRTHYQRWRRKGNTELDYKSWDRNFEPPIPAVIAGHSWINLGNGAFAKIDKDDFERINKYVWHISAKDRFGNYAYARNVLVGKMHRFVLDAPKNMEVDHINHDTLDNRKNNLRLVSRAQNMQNRISNKNTGSKYKGVHKPKNRPNLWIAMIGNNKKRIYLGCFRDEKKAAAAYNAKALELFGERAYLNNLEI